MVEDAGSTDPIDAVAAAALAGQDRRRAIERSRIDMIRGYAETPGCRRAALLGYFGEPFEPQCGNCDHCVAGIVEAPAAAAGTWNVGDRVDHATFGRGLVTGVADGVVTVAFDDVGYKTLDATLAADAGLLKLAGPESQ